MTSRVLEMMTQGELASQACDEAFASLVRRQSQFVFRVAFSVVRNVQDAEDVVQETFLKIYRGGERITMRDEKAFLARVAWRLAVSRVRRSAKTSLPEDPADASPSVEAALIKADGEAAVHRLMSALPLKLRLPLALSTVDEMTSPEIAAVMGISEGTVRTRLARARELLRKKLTEREVRRA